MIAINTAQAQELTFLSGITDQGLVATQSFQSWNRDAPATYSTQSLESKWGGATAGTGGVVQFSFDAASHWSANETGAFLSAMHLWSAVANISFVATSDPGAANLVIGRGADGAAQTAYSVVPGVEGSARLGTALTAEITIDTSVAGFGPIGGSLSTEGGYPWMTILHELGHSIGLGHAGPYNEGQTTIPTMLTSYDTTAWSVMSYNGGTFQPAGPHSPVGWGVSPDGYLRVPTTPMPLDILALQRIYGLPVSTPLFGGQVFGFHSNIRGDIAQFFDFTVNAAPVVTLWDAGGNNTLDLSGYGAAQSISLIDGTFSSVGGHSGNLAIAFGTRIDTAIGGTGYDGIVGNGNGDVLMGNSGGDSITGGAGNDHIYGNMATSVQGSVDGDDVIDAGAGSNYVNGNGGNDHITAGAGTNRLYGGAGNDVMSVSGGGDSHLNGNIGDDIISVTTGANTLHGGQGNDQILATGGTNWMYGDAGNDVLSGGTGIDFMTGGVGSDLFVLHGPNILPTGTPPTYDEIVDYLDGTDKFHIDMTALVPLPAVVHGASAFTNEASAESYAVSLLNATAATSEVVALQVGADTYLFYHQGGSIAGAAETVDTVVKLGNVSAGTIDTSDFMLGVFHL